MAGRIVVRGTHVRESLFWLMMAFIFGGLPLVVYFTEPGATVGNLIAAILLGVPLFGLSMFFLGRGQAIVLRPETRELVFVDGLFHGRKVEVFRYENVGQLEALTQYPAGEVRLLVRVTGGRLLSLSQRSTEQARQNLLLLRKELGVSAVDHGKPL